jgi:hypothetical protein
MELGVLISSYWCSSYGASDPFRSLGTLSRFFLGDLELHPMGDCEHTLLYLPGTDKGPQETAISGYCHQTLVGICHSVWVWWLFMGWIPKWGIPWMVTSSVSAPNFVSVLVKVQLQLQLKAQNWRGHAVFWRCQYHEMTTKSSSRSGVQASGA